MNKGILSALLLLWGTSLFGDILPKYLQRPREKNINYYDEMLEKDNPTLESAVKVASKVHDIKRSIDSTTTMETAYKNSNSNCDTTVIACPSKSKHNPKCDFKGVDEEWKTKCDQLYSSQIPKGALDFTLGVMAKNSTLFGSNKCFDKAGLAKSYHPSMGGTKSRDIRTRMKGGLQNKCIFIINDMGEKKAPCRGTMYYINMCKPGRPKITETYVNIGTGTCRERKGHQNVSGKHTTILGAFLTNDHVFNFGATKESYNRTRSIIKKISRENKAHAVQLFGLQNTNNGASRDMKYLHVSPYQSSWGCPSINAKNYWMVKEMAKHHPSLLVNYHKGKMENINKCSRN
ncbi:MAG: hypothetical protein KAG61_01610 [Bacteriovoracaceae bacterium]|nr:hypothetical protein [Bacteriovoracaceae bacterium]